jgi:hypothetical protein
MARSSGSGFSLGPIRFWSVCSFVICCFSIVAGDDENSESKQSVVHSLDSDLPHGTFGLLTISDFFLLLIHVLIPNKLSLTVGSQYGSIW